VGTASTLLLLVAVADPSDLAQPLEVAPRGEEDTSNVWIVSGVSSAIVAGLLAWATQAWWEDGLEPFSFRETGAFGHETYAGGADKVGHAYANYMMTHVGAALYRSLGMSPTRAAIYAAAGTFLVANWFELIDGFTKFGFEYGDVIANTFGAGLGLLTQIFPEVDETVGFRIGYVPSRDFLDNDKSVLKWINDYSGMAFFGDLKLRGVFHAFGEDPGFARFVLCGVVYSTGDYSPIRRDAEKHRALGFHVGLDFAEVIRWMADGDDGMIDVGDLFDYYAVPFLSVAVMRDLDDGEWFINFGVANRLQIGL
jgi:hypothetical protein